MFDVTRLGPEHDHVIATKLCLPRHHPNLISRTRLVERLNQGMHRKLTLISAPAGFGKTTLLVTWIENARAFKPSNAQTLFAWVSLDEADNDGTRFWAHILADCVPSFL